MTVGGFPVIRWAQTADYGYVPNPKQRNVFMACAIDLGDPKSPYGSGESCPAAGVGFFAFDGATRCSHAAVRCSCGHQSTRSTSSRSALGWR